MMLRPSEMEAKRKSMKRDSDPRSDIQGTSDRAVKEEVEERREIDQVGISQKDSVGTRPEVTRLRRRGPGP
jgi:hypothetical protein